MSCRISCTAGWHRTIVCVLTLYGILIATWLEILVLIESVADVFQCSCSLLLIKLRVWLFIAIQPKAIGCQPIFAIQSTSQGWQDDVETCVRYMHGELSWQDAVQQVLERTDVNFGDFKLFIGEYLNRYICQFKNAYFKGCFGCIRFIFTLCSNLNLTSLFEKINVGTLQME